MSASLPPKPPRGGTPGAPPAGTKPDGPEKPQAASSESLMIALLQGAIKAWREPEFTLGPPEKRRMFEIRPLLVMEGHAVYEQLRYAIAVQLREVSAEKSMPLSILSVLMGIPVPTMEGIRKALFAEIIFLPPEGKDWLPLGANEGLAFESVDEIYEVLARAIVVNFPTLPRLLGHALRLVLLGSPPSPGESAPIS